MATQFDVEGVLGSSPSATVTLVFILTGDCNASAESSLSWCVTAYSSKQRYGQKLEITLCSVQQAFHQTHYDFDQTSFLFLKSNKLIELIHVPMQVLSISMVVNMFDFLYLFFMLVKGIKDSI